MDDVTTDHPAGEPTDGPAGDLVKKTRPVAGALWGVLFGLGLALLAVNFKIITLELVPALLVFVVGVVLAVLWSLFGPAKKPKTT